MFIQGAGSPQLSVVGSDAVLTWDGNTCTLVYSPAVGGQEEVIFVPGFYRFSTVTPLYVAKDAPIAQPAQGPTSLAPNVRVGNDGQLTPAGGG
jgi:hypothetical protein